MSAEQMTGLSASPDEAIQALGDDFVRVDANVEADHWEEASGWARISVYAVPVAIAHLALVYALLSAIFEFRLPKFLHVDGLVAWLWVNGAALGLGAWLWRKGRFPLAPGQWLQGKSARWMIAIWLGASLGWFLLPAFLRDAWDALTRATSDW